MSVHSPRTHRPLTVGVCTAFSLSSPLLHLRILNPLRALRRQVTFRLIHDAQSFTPDCDLYILQRDFVNAQNYALITDTIVPNHTYLFEIDDLLSAMPASHPEFKHYASGIIGSIEKFLADTPQTKIITSTETLAEALAPQVAHAFVFRNHLPHALIHKAHAIAQKSRDTSDGVVRIGFAGTTSHSLDLKKIESALLRLAALYRDRIEIILWGAATQDLEACDQVRVIRTATGYWNYLPALARLGLDIAIAPLDDTPFNRCKSDLKWLEYSALGIPTVCSDVTPFAEAKATGLAKVVPNDPEAWLEALIDLVEKRDERRALGEAAFEHVAQLRYVEKHAEKYGAILNAVLPEERQIALFVQGVVQPVTPPSAEAIANPEDRYDAWLKRRTLQEADAEVLAERMMSWQNPPLVSLITFARKEDLARLADTSTSLQSQLYPHWRWIVVSDQPVPDPVFEQADFLGWLQVESLDAPEIVAQAVNALLPEYGGDCFALLPPGFRLAPEALLLVSEAFVTDPQVVAVYSDHDSLDEGTRTASWFKPDFDRILFYGFDYVGAALWFRTEALLALGGLNPYPQAELYDALLRLSESLTARIAHITEPLVTLPESGNYAPPGFADRDATPEEAAHLARRLALEDHLRRTGQYLQIREGLQPGTWLVEAVHPLPSVSVIVPIADVYHLVAAALHSLLTYTDYPDWEVIVVDHATSDPDIAALLQELAADHPRVKIVRDEGPYALGRLYNVGAAVASGDVLTFLHCDVEIRDPRWLERLARTATLADVGAVGPLVLLPEFTLIESAGLWLGSGDLWQPARPAYRGSHIEEPGILNQLTLPHRVSALPSVGFTTRRETFTQLGGFDETFALAGFEIDYCLRAHDAGLMVLLQPLSRIIHQSGAALARLNVKPLEQLTHQEAVTASYRALHERWGERLALDPFASPHFDYGVTVPRVDLAFPRSWQRHHHNRIKALGFPVKGGSGQYRVRIPLRALVRAGWLQAEAVPEEARLPSVTELAKVAPDVVLLHQRLGPAVEETVRAWRKSHPKLRILYGMDDRLDAVPRKSSIYHHARRTTRDARARLRNLFALSDAVVVSTAPLAELVRDIRPETEVHIIPNAIERETWEPLFRELEVKRRMPTRLLRKPRVGWIGAMQHRGDLELLIPVIEATKNDVHWVFMGMWLPEFEHLVAEKHGWVDFNEYPKKMAALDLDLALAPLELNEFNEAKSNLRLIEYGALGYPVIATDITPYRTNNPPVTLLPNEPDLWIDAIRKQLFDSKRLLQKGRDLHQWVIENYILDDWKNQWNQIVIG